MFLFCGLFFNNIQDKNQNTAEKLRSFLIETRIFLIFEFNVFNFRKIACPVDSIIEKVDPTVDRKKSWRLYFSLALARLYRVTQVKPYFIIKHISSVISIRIKTFFRSKHTSFISMTIFSRSKSASIAALSFVSSSEKVVPLRENFASICSVRQVLQQKLDENFHVKARTLW